MFTNLAGNPKRHTHNFVDRYRRPARSASHASRNCRRKLEELKAMAKEKKRRHRS